MRKALSAAKAPVAPPPLPGNRPSAEHGALPAGDAAPPSAGAPKKRPLNAALLAQLDRVRPPKRSMSGLTATTSNLDGRSEGGISDWTVSKSGKERKAYTLTKRRERWTDKEHELFLEAVKLYGREWPKIEEHIGTKTAIQIRSHAQKFFTKLERGLVASPSELEIEVPPPRPKRKSAAQLNATPPSDAGTDTPFQGPQPPDKPPSTSMPMPMPPEAAAPEAPMPGTCDIELDSGLTNMTDTIAKNITTSISSWAAWHNIQGFKTGGKRQAADDHTVRCVAAAASVAAAAAATAVIVAAGEPIYMSLKRKARAGQLQPLLAQPLDSMAANNALPADWKVARRVEEEMLLRQAGGAKAEAPEMLAGGISGKLTTVGPGMGPLPNAAEGRGSAEGGNSGGDGGADGSGGEDGSGGKGSGGGSNGGSGTQAAASGKPAKGGAGKGNLFGMEYIFDPTSQAFNSPDMAQQAARRAAAAVVSGQLDISHAPLWLAQLLQTMNTSWGASGESDSTAFKGTSGSAAANGSGSDPDSREKGNSTDDATRANKAGSGDAPPLPDGSGTCQEEGRPGEAAELRSVGAGGLGPSSGSGVRLKSSSPDEEDGPKAAADLKSGSGSGSGSGGSAGKQMTIAPEDHQSGKAPPPLGSPQPATQPPPTAAARPRLPFLASATKTAALYAQQQRAANMSAPPNKRPRAGGHAAVLTAAERSHSAGAVMETQEAHRAGRYPAATAGLAPSLSMPSGLMPGDKPRAPSEAPPPPSLPARTPDRNDSDRLVMPPPPLPTGSPWTAPRKGEEALWGQPQHGSYPQPPPASYPVGLGWQGLAGAPAHALSPSSYQPGKSGAGYGGAPYWPPRPEDWQHILGEGAAKAAGGSMQNMSENTLTTWFTHQLAGYSSWMRHSAKPPPRHGHSHGGDRSASLAEQHAMAMRAGAAAGASALDGAWGRPRGHPGAAAAGSPASPWATGFNPADMASFQAYVAGRGASVEPGGGMPVPISGPARRESGGLEEARAPLPVPYSVPPLLNNQMFVNQMMMKMSMHSMFPFGGASGRGDHSGGGPKGRPGPAFGGEERSGSRLARSKSRSGSGLLGDPGHPGSSVRRHSGSPMLPPGGGDKARAGSLGGAPHGGSQGGPGSPAAGRRSQSTGRGESPCPSRDALLKASAAASDKAGTVACSGEFVAAAAMAAAAAAMAGAVGFGSDGAMEEDAEGDAPRRRAVKRKGNSGAGGEGNSAGEDDPGGSHGRRSHGRQRSSAHARRHFRGSQSAARPSKRRKHHRGCGPNSPARSVGSGASSSGFQGDYRSGGEEAHCPRQASGPPEDCGTRPFPPGGPFSGDLQAASMEYLYQVAAVQQQQQQKEDENAQEQEEAGGSGSGRPNLSVPGSSSQPDCAGPGPASNPSGSAPGGSPSARKFELRSSGDEFGGSTSNGSDEGSNEPSGGGDGNLTNNNKAPQNSLLDVSPRRPKDEGEKH
eukprot:jgi/Tetstr1/441920/TSEL_030127.t1